MDLLRDQGRRVYAVSRLPNKRLIYGRCRTRGREGNEMKGVDYFRVACARDPKPYQLGSNGKYACPCCTCFTLDEYDCYEICPVCFWQDDGAVNDRDYGGPNHMTLEQGRAEFRRIGCCKERMLEHCRIPTQEEATQ